MGWLNLRVAYPDLFCFLYRLDSQERKSASCSKSDKSPRGNDIHDRLIDTLLPQTVRTVSYRTILLRHWLIVGLGRGLLVARLLLQYLHQSPGALDVQIIWLQKIANSSWIHFSVRLFRESNF